MAPTAESLGSVESVRGTIAGLLRNSLAVLFVCVVLAPTARAFEWCPNALGPDAWCPDGWACCPYPYGPGYWC